MTPASTAAPAAKSNKGTKLELCLRRTGVVEHHEFVLNLPEGVTKEQVIAEFKQCPEYIWQLWRTQNGQSLGVKADRFLDCGAELVKHFEGDTNDEFASFAVIED